MPIQPVSLAVFVPSKNYAESQQFYTFLGFEKVFDTGSLSQMRLGPVSFLLQDFYQAGLANNLMLQMSVNQLDEVSQLLTELQQTHLPQLKFTPPEQTSWGRVTYLWGPAGELWYLVEDRSQISQSG